MNRNFLGANGMVNIDEPTASKLWGKDRSSKGGQKLYNLDDYSMLGSVPLEYKNFGDRNGIADTLGVGSMLKKSDGSLHRRLMVCRVPQVSDGSYNIARSRAGL